MYSWYSYAFVLKGKIGEIWHDCEIQYYCIVTALIPKPTIKVNNLTITYKLFIKSQNQSEIAMYTVTWSDKTIKHAYTTHIMMCYMIY